MIKSKRLAQVILSGVPDEIKQRINPKLDYNTGADHDLTVWSGVVSPKKQKDKKGNPIEITQADWDEREHHFYVCPQLVVRPATVSQESWRWGTGLEAANVKYFCTIHVEIDKKSTQAEQVASIRQLCHDASLPIPLIGWSGTKSVHAFWPIRAIANDPDNAARWTYALKLLVALVEGDKAAVSVGRRMRFVGWGDGTREQPILDDGDCRPIELEDAITGLESAAAERDIVVAEPIVKHHTPRSSRTPGAARNVPQSSQQDIDDAKKWLAFHPAPRPGERHDSWKGPAKFLAGTLDDKTGHDMLFDWAAPTLDGDIAELEDLWDWTLLVTPGPEKDPRDLLTELAQSGVFFEVGLKAESITGHDTLSNSGEVKNSPEASQPGRLEASPDCVNLNSDYLIKAGKVDALDPLANLPKTYPGINIFRSGLGTGKTHWMAELCKDKDTLVITSTRKLAQELGPRFNVTCYLDEMGEMDYPRAIVCVPSIRRIKHRSFKRIVLDEVSTDLDMMFEKKIMRETVVDGDDRYKASTIKEVWVKHTDLMLQCVVDGGEIYASDANTADSDLSCLTRLVGKPVPVHIIELPSYNPPYPAAPTEFYPRYGHLLYELTCDADAGKQGTIACTTKADVEALAYILHHSCKVPLDRILRITGDSAEMPPVSEWDNYSWIIFNQAAGQGVSYPGVGRVSYAFLNVWGTPVTAFMLSQLCMRHRHPTERKIFVSERQNYHLPKTREEVAARVYLRQEINWRLTWSDEDQALKRVPEDPEITESLIDREWLRARTARYPAKMLRKIIPGQMTSKTLLLSTIMESEQYRLDVGKEIRKKGVDAAMSASDITSERFKAIRDASKFGRNVTEEERAQAARYQAQLVWGQADEMTIAAELDPSQRIRKAGETIAAIASVQNGQHIFKGGLRYLEQRWSRGCLSAQNLTELRARCIKQVTAAWGVDWATIGAVCETLTNPLIAVPTIPDMPLDFRKKSRIKNAMLDSMGLARGSKETAAQHGQRVLRMIGLRAESQRVKGHGKQQRTYCLADPIEWLLLTRRMYARTIGIQVATPDYVRVLPMDASEAEIDLNQTQPKATTPKQVTLPVDQSKWTVEQILDFWNGDAEMAPLPA